VNQIIRKKGWHPFETAAPAYNQPLCYNTLKGLFVDVYAYFFLSAISTATALLSV